MTAVGSLMVATVVSGLVLTSTSASANDTVIDDVAVTVPVSCTMTGSGMTSHTGEIVNGTYEDDIGTTTLKTFCTDNEGFAIYAAGYTNNEIGGTDSNKLIGNPVSAGNISTGTATTGNTSNWAMQLATDSTATYALTIDNGFSNYSSVPNSYTKVAHRDSATDISTPGNIGTGATLTSTYAAYMAPSQTTGTYSGQVIYTLVHPASEVPKQRVTKTFTVNYTTENTPLFFDSGRTQTQNNVTYSMTCAQSAPRSYDILKTSNLSDNGTQNGGYTGDDIDLIKTYSGASKIRVDVDYGFTANTGRVFIGYYDETLGDNVNYEIYSETNNISGTQTYTINSNEVYVNIATWDDTTLASGYDYGAYVTVTPLDANDQAVPIYDYSDCEWETLSGTYLEPIYTTGGGWFYNWYYGNGFSSFSAPDEERLLQSVGNNLGLFNDNSIITVHAQLAI